MSYLKNFWMKLYKMVMEILLTNKLEIKRKEDQIRKKKENINLENSLNIEIIKLEFIIFKLILLII